jgi:hypothetical protein
MGRLRPTGRQIVFTIRELAELMGLPKKRTVLIMRSNGVKMHWAGQARIVTLGALDQAMPDVVDSIRYRHGDNE